MAIKDTINSMYDNLRAAYAKVEEKGGEIPTDKNLYNLTAAILSIETDPTIPTLRNLKQALMEGTAQEYFPVGTEFPDTYDGNENPLIVLDYLDSSNNQQYGGAEGAVLVRKFVEPTSQKFGSSNVYSQSDMKEFLDGTYLPNCSKELKRYISPITVPLYNGEWMGYVYFNNWFLMSDYEVCSNNSEYRDYPEGIMFQYWKDKTGLTTPDQKANNGRLIYTRDGKTAMAYLRTKTVSNAVCYMANGAVFNTLPSMALGVLPACFISATAPIQFSLEELYNALQDGSAEDTIPVGSEIKDTYAGEDSPLVVVDYGEYQDADGQTFYGATLERKFIVGYGTMWDVNADGKAIYSESTIDKFLTNEYANNCSEELRERTSPIQITAKNQEGNEVIVRQFFCASKEEVAAEAGKPFQLFSNIVPATEDPRVIRATGDSTGVARAWWLRDSYLSDNGYRGCGIKVDGGQYASLVTSPSRSVRAFQTMLSTHGSIVEAAKVYHSNPTNGTTTINNLWQGSIWVNDQEIPEGGSYTHITTAGTPVTYVIKGKNEVLQNWTEGSQPFITHTGNTKFILDLSDMRPYLNGTKANDNFFRSFNRGGAISGFTEGSLDTSMITEVGANFFNGFNANGGLTELPAGSFDTRKIKKSLNGIFYDFNRTGSLTSLPEGSFRFDSWEYEEGWSFSNFNRSGALKSLPAGSFQFPKITKTESSFFANFNGDAGALTVLPKGSFNTDNIVTAGERYFYCFNFNGKLASLPLGSFSNKNMTAGGTEFMYGFNGTGSLSVGNGLVKVYFPVAATNFSTTGSLPSSVSARTTLSINGVDG